MVILVHQKLTRSVPWIPNPSTSPSERTSTTFEGIGAEAKRQKAVEASSVEGLWDNRDKAERILKEVKYWTNLIEAWQKIGQKGKDLVDLEKIINTDDKSEVEALEKDRKALEAEYRKAHVELFLSGPYDKNDAIMVISAGTGGVEAQDWAEMLLRMYLRYFEKKGFSFSVTEKQMGGEAGIKKAVIEVKGMLAYGYLKSENGVHRLVRLSPFNAKNLRQTSFALVEVLPVLADDEGIVIDPKDLRVDTFRSSGPGGQNVNKTESAVRFTHIPTGIVVACQTERSQIQNRIQGLAILRAKLLQRLIDEKKEKVEELKGGYKEAAFGNQIRSYTFQPYTLVKDHRTDAETNQVHQVMDGDLDLFIEAYLLETTKPKA